MRKILALLVFIVFLFSAPTIVLAQDDKKFDELFLEYNLKVEEYQKAHEEYVLKRAQYFSFHTLKSQEEAQETTLKMLTLRDTVVILYIQSLKARLNEAVGVKEEKKSELNLLLDGDTDWFSSHKENLKSAGTLADLVADSEEARVRFKADQGLFFQVLSSISSGRVYDFRERFGNTFTLVKEKLEEIRTEDREGYALPTEKFQVIDRWIFDAEARVTRSDEKLQGVEDAIATILKRRSGATSATFLGEYNKILEGLGEAQLFLKESASYLREVIREIRVLD